MLKCNFQTLNMSRATPAGLWRRNIFCGKEVKPWERVVTPWVPHSLSGEQQCEPRSACLGLTLPNGTHYFLWQRDTLFTAAQMLQTFSYSHGSLHEFPLGILPSSFSFFGPFPSSHTTSSKALWMASSRTFANFSVSPITYISLGDEMF